MTHPATNDSVGFDRAAGYYDATRSVPPETAARVTQVLVAALEATQPVLEIGVGTGRIAGDLSAAGLDVFGIDLSARMLAQVTSTGRQVAVVQADCTALPFPADRFGSVVASHVLHLVPGWHGAVAEARRVTRSAGLLLHARGGLGPRVEDLAAAFADVVGLDRTPPGLGDVTDLDDHLGADGVEGEWLEGVPDARLLSAHDLVGVFESGIMGWTWSLTDDERARAGEGARSWAAANLDDLERPEPFGREIRFRAYRLP